MMCPRTGPTRQTARLDDNNAWPLERLRVTIRPLRVVRGLQLARLHPYPESRILRRLGAYHLLIRWLPLPSQKT
jgi:hypothetical protein